MIVKNNQKDLLTYLEDTSNCPGKASAVYLPQNRNELLAIIRELSAKNIPFTAQGGRTGTTGGGIPQEGAVLSLEALKDKIQINPEEKTAKLSAGVSLEELEKEAKKYTLTLRALPTEFLAQAGGVVSTAASGVRGFGWGGIRNYVQQIELCLSSGEVINLRRGEIFAHGRVFDAEGSGRRFNFKLPSYNLPACKSQAGYFVKDNMDLIDLFIGSEGTLGVVISVELILQKVAWGVFDAMLFFPKVEQALDLAEKIKELKKKNVLSPASLEFFDQNSLDLLRKEYSFIPEAGAAVYFEQEAESKEEYEFLFEHWQGLMEKSGALLEVSILGETPQEREKIYQIRHKLPQLINELLRQRKQVKAASDIAVPENNFQRMYEYYQEVSKKAKINYVNFGHIGEAHLHYNFLPQNNSESQVAKTYLTELCRLAVALGGTVSAEHGIGKLKKPYLKLMYSAGEINQMAALKKYFDPQCLLGLDNIFDRELLGTGPALKA